MNAPRYWHWRNERSKLLETVQKCLSFIAASTITLRRDEFHSRVGNSFPHCQQLYEVSWNLQRAPTGWGTGGIF
jgi:hypothetical protein